MNEPKSLVSKAAKKLRYGTLLHSLLGQLQRIGIAIHPYYLVSEQRIPASELQLSIEPKLDALTTEFLTPDEIYEVMTPLEEARAEKRLHSPTTNRRRMSLLWCKARTKSYRVHVV